MQTNRNPHPTDLRSPRKRLSAKSVIGYLAMLVLTIALLYLSFRGVKWDEFADGLSNCRWEWIALSMGFGVAGFAIRALRWKMLLLQLDKKASFISAYQGVTIGNLANFALPRVGEIVRCGVASKAKKSDITIEGAIGTVIVERTWDLLCLVILSVLFVSFSWNKFGEFIKAQIFNTSRSADGTSAVWLVVMLTAAVILAVAFIVSIYAYRKKIEKWKLGAKLLGFCRKLWDGITAAFRMKNKSAFFILTILLWGSFLVTSVCTIKAFPAFAGLNWSDALFLMIAGSLGWAVPVQGGIGSYHFIVSLALVQVYATTQSDGLVFATISHESQAVVMILCGAVSLIHFLLKNRTLTKPTE